MINKKHLLIGCSAATVVALVLLGVAAFVVYRALRDPLRTMTQAPPPLRQTGVLVGEGLLTREVFSSDRRLSQIQAMAFGPVESGAPDELCAASGFGALFLDTAGATKRYIQYGMQHVKIFGMKLQAAGGRTSRFQIIDVGDNGDCSFLARDNPMGAELIGHDGKSLWQLGGGIDIRSHSNDAVAGDLNGDGKTEFVATYYLGNRGVVLYDASLNQLWSEPEIRATHLELVDSENGKKNIACSEWNGLAILDPQGSLVRRFDTEAVEREFIILTWPPNSGSQYALFHSRDQLDLYDLNGKLSFKLLVPKGDDLFRIAATTITVGRASYLAMVGATTFSDKRSVLCVYGLPEHGTRSAPATGAPLYQEVLAGDYETITRLPADESGAESFLIGGFGQILRYKTGSLPSEPPKRLKPTSPAGPGRSRSRTGP